MGLPRTSNTSMAPGAVPTARKAPLGEADTQLMGPSSRNTWGGHENTKTRLRTMLGKEGDRVGQGGTGSCSYN